MGTNVLRIQRTRQGNGASSMVFRNPLRIFEVGRALEDEQAQFVLGTYGGGMVQGDDIRLEISAGEGSKSLIRSQANTHILKNNTGKKTVFTVEGVLGPGSQVIYTTEPTVLHSSSRFHQIQHWKVHPTARLLLQDWFHSGRSESGESFQFTQYRTELRLTLGEKDLVFERFQMEPAALDPFNPAIMGGLDHMVSLYFLGDFTGLNSDILELPSPSEEIRRFRPLESLDSQGPGVLTSGTVACSYRAGSCLVVRILGKFRSDLEPLVQRILTSVQNLPAQGMGLGDQGNTLNSGAL